MKKKWNPVKITCGVDIGARSIDIVLFDGEQIIDSTVADTGARPRDKSLSLFKQILSRNSVREEDLARTVATGYGRNYFQEADEAVSEIICHAAGARFFFPESLCVIDIGGQDSKVVRMLPSGKVCDFSMNDRCAAGTGRFMEMVADILEIELNEIGGRTFKGCGFVDISSMCAVFAESEIIGLLQNQVPEEEILKGVFRAVAKRVISLMGAGAPPREIVFTGGVSRVRGVGEAIGEEAGAEIFIPENPQLTGALGAAIIGYRSSLP